MDNKLIGNRIKTRRKELNLTQSDIYKSTGISTGNISDMENGVSLPSASALVQLSSILDCSVDWILTGQVQSLSNEMAVNTLGSKLTRLIEENRINSSTLAKEIGVSHTTIRKIEAGTHSPSFETICKVANYFDVSLDYFRIDRVLNTNLNSASTNSDKSQNFNKYQFIARMTDYFIKFSRLSNSDQNEVIKVIESKLRTYYDSK